RAPAEEALEDLARAGRVAGLRGEARAGGVRRHALVGHRSPRVVPGRRLREPHVARVAGQPPALACARDGVAIADLPARGVDQVGAPLHLADQLLVEQVLGLGVQGRVDRDYFT